MLTKESVAILSDVDDITNLEKQIKDIINDRNAYTHASKELKPVMNIEQLEIVNCCYKEFYRIRVLKKLEFIRSINS